MGRYITSNTRVSKEQEEDSIEKEKNHLHLMIHILLLPSCLESVVLLREGVVLDRQRGGLTAGGAGWWVRYGDCIGSIAELDNGLQSSGNRHGRQGYS